MPQDDWKKANDRGSKRKRRRLFRQMRDPERVAPRFSENSVLWFGKHKDKAIQDVPSTYLLWLAQQPGDNSWRMKGLKLFLRRYLERTQPLPADSSQPPMASVAEPQSAASLT